MSTFKLATIDVIQNYCKHDQNISTHYFHNKGNISVQLSSNTGMKADGANQQLCYNNIIMEQLLTDVLMFTSQTLNFNVYQ